MASGGVDAGLFKLRCTLLGHSMDVRGVATGQTEGGKEFIVSGSRDRSSKVWMPSDTDNGFVQFQSCEGHTNFVSCVHTIPPNDKHPTGLILSGGHDHTILAYEMGKHQPVFRLVGHKGTVCSIGGTSDSLIVSGSWDLSAKVWEEQNCVASLTGHTAAVWAVATVPGTVGEHRILTGSADKEIRLWINYQSSKVYSGHTDCVRTLAVINSDQFLSGSNDASIRLWSIADGETLQTFYGHTNFIYSIAILPSSNGFVSVGEDRTLRIWQNGATSQVLFHPAISVWTVACLSNGDVVTGSSDGALRVFTSDPDRYAAHETLAAFEEEVSHSVLAAQQDLGGMKISELPGRECLFIPGKSDGETKMVREGEKVGCYSWSAAEKKWDKVGDVVGASGATQNTSGKVLHEGKEYDYVFAVDLEGQKALKLPYNVTEDPWFAAQKFIDKNELSQLFLDQVANFIINNTKGMQLGNASDSNDFVDPFTGGNRYMPGSGGGSGFSSAGSVGAALDPFTGSGAYTTSTSQPAQKSTGSATELNNSNSGPCFPTEEFIRFTTPPNYVALEKKLVEFVTSMGEDSSSGRIQTLLDIGRKAEWNVGVEKEVRQCLGSWPGDKIFPILDLLRLAVATPSFVLGLDSSINVVTEFCGKFMDKGTPTNQMLSLRLLCNAFGPLTPQLAQDRSIVVSRMLTNLAKGKTNEIAAATLILNYSIVVAGLNKNPILKWATSDAQTEILMTAVQMLDHVDEPEALFRLLVTIGNLVYGNSRMADLFSNLGGTSLLRSYKDVTSSVLPKVKNCCEQIEASMISAISGGGPSSSSRMN